MSLTGHPLTDLTDGILAVLLGSELAAQVPGGFVPQLPQDPTYPIVRVTTRGTPVGPINGSADWRCDVELDVYSYFRGDTECLAIADGLTRLLNQQPLAVDGWTVSLVNLWNLYTVEDEFVNEQMVSRWTLPFMVWMHAA